MLRPWHRIGVLLLAVLLGFAREANAERPSFTLSVSPTEVSLGDTVVVTVRIEMPGLVGPDRYWHPSAAEFRQVDSQVKRSTESSVDAANGQQITTVELYRYVLEPKTTGRLSIGPARIRVQGEEWETRERFVRVRVSGSRDITAVGLGHTDAEALSAPGYTPPQGPRDDVFLYAVTDKTTAWVGEQLTVSWLLFARAEVLKYEATPPRLADLWSETLFEPTAFFKYTDARLGDKDYVVALVSKRAIFATESGTLRIEPLRATIATVSTAMGRGQSIASNELAVTIKPLPDSAPAGFDPSYVGEFRVQASVDRDLLQAGEALTLSLRVSGQGAIRRTKPPRLAFPGFVFDEPRDFEEESRPDGDQVGGHRLYRYWTTPSQGGEQSIPAISLAYFSPEKGEYQVARTSAIGITVQGDPKAQQDADKRDVAASLDRDIRLLRPTSDVESRVFVDLYRRDLFWYLLVAPPLLLVGLIITEKVRLQLNAETAKTRRKRARAAAKTHYKIAEIHLRGERSAKFFGELSLAIYGHLEEWLARSMRSMTRPQMREFLEERGIERGTIRRLLDDLESFDRERFAPSVTDPDKMREAMARTKKVLAAIEAQKTPDSDSSGKAAS